MDGLDLTPLHFVPRPLSVNGEGEERSLGDAEGVRFALMRTFLSRNPIKPAIKWVFLGGYYANFS